VGGEARTSYARGEGGECKPLEAVHGGKKGSNGPIRITRIGTPKYPMAKTKEGIPIGGLPQGGMPT